MIELITNLTLCVAAISASVYCWVLSRRLKRFAALDTGVGAAIVALSKQVDQLQHSVENAKRIATASRRELEIQSRDAESLARRLELILAASNDLRGVPESVDLDKQLDQELDRELEWQN